MKVPIGVVALLNGEPHSGGQYRSGVKCYKTAGMAKGAITQRFKYWRDRSKVPVITYAPAYIEVPDKESV